MEEVEKRAWLIRERRRLDIEDAERVRLMVIEKEGGKKFAEYAEEYIRKRGTNGGSRFWGIVKKMFEEPVDTKERIAAMNVILRYGEGEPPIHQIHEVIHSDLREKGTSELLEYLFGQPEFKPMIEEVLRKRGVIVDGVPYRAGVRMIKNDGGDRDDDEKGEEGATSEGGSG